ncbi:hypothetical protein SCB49_14770 [unidentified eubacterium SCB49]|nr:hypothetical protein SCB49_14770 [unidentified eubacterium SCB49]
MERGQLEIEHYGYIDSEYDSIYGNCSITEMNNEGHTIYGTWLLKRKK